MSQYNQFMKHWHNHRKDRFTQQCGGPVHHIEDQGNGKVRYMILDETESVVFADDEYETVIERGRQMQKPERYWFASSKMIYGRLDLVLASEDSRK